MEMLVRMWYETWAGRARTPRLLKSSSFEKFVARWSGFNTRKLAPCFTEHQFETEAVATVPKLDSVAGKPSPTCSTSNKE